MTMPIGQARALRWAGELLSQLQIRLYVPEDICSRAQRIFRHYPGASDITLCEDREAGPGSATPRAGNGVQDAP